MSEKRLPRNASERLRSFDATDHGSLAGLGDDDHTQYLLASGSRALTGDLDFGSNDAVAVARLLSSAGLPLIEFTYTASGVNYLRIQSQTSGGGAKIVAVGSDTHIDLPLEPKGTNGRIKERINGTSHTIVSSVDYTAKGDILAGTGASARSAVTVGSDGAVLQADSSQSAGVRWRSAPQLVVSLNAAPVAGSTWTNQPAADTFLFGSSRHIMQADLTGYRQVRLVVNKQATAAKAGATIRAVYRTSFSTTESDYASIGTSAVSVATDTTNAMLTTSWVDLAAGAKADVFVGAIGAGGDGAIDPTFGSISLQFR